jgi:hypothetical protein
MKAVTRKMAYRLLRSNSLYPFHIILGIIKLRLVRAKRNVLFSSCFCKHHIVPSFCYLPTSRVKLHRRWKACKSCGWRWHSHFPATSVVPLVQTQVAFAAHVEFTPKDTWQSVVPMVHVLPTVNSAHGNQKSDILNFHGPFVVESW